MDESLHPTHALDVVEMEDSMYSSEILLDTAPEAQPELRLQSRTHADEFTYFTKLPVELRLIIWRAAFRRPCKVSLEPPSLDGWRSHPYVLSHEVQNENPNPHPITLSVCQESRAETLKHYIICYRTQNLADGKHSTVPYRDRKPLIFDPKRDGAVVRFAEFSKTKYSSPFLSWYRLMTYQCRGALSLCNLRNLQIRGIEWKLRTNPAWHKFVLDYPNLSKPHRIGTETETGRTEIDMKKMFASMNRKECIGSLLNILRFPGLEEIHISEPLVLFENQHEYQLAYTKAVAYDFFAKLCVKWLRDFLEEHKVCFTSRVAPQVIHDWGMRFGHV